MNLNPVIFFKGLSDETRLRCMLLLSHEGELCVCELTSALDDIQPKISRHLSQLKQAKLLLDRRQGQWVFYRLNPELPDWAKQTLDKTCSQNQAFIQPNLAALKKMAGRPDAPRCN
ncbi:metalloregulator ArsR/SmtB family transcription factor [Pelagibaculum spongiae]|uniref:Transcriptional regulator n=1 Tax=Pelagibaculum spongiae TaxID=2080658 RepID=A0A2V1H266_9GAMM|nr:metalloregulator ArsR/SmtB family transcription factor [Pelagibaculum spongiae]PVZ72060.1 transcriptional regulator [Pelagibaculum spongiae]